MLMKRGTKKLKKLGYANLEVNKGLWGFSARDIRFKSQLGTTIRKTQDEVIADIQNGKKPKKYKWIKVE